MAKIRNFLLLFLNLGIGLMLANSPADMSHNVCEWLEGADLSCPGWLAAVLKTTLAYLTVYGIIFFTVIFLLFSLVALLRQKKQISHDHFPQPGNIMSMVARTWAETGTWTPTLRFSDGCFIETGIAKLNAKYWNYGGYTEIDGMLTVKLGEGASLEGASIVGLPFVPYEDRQIKIACEEQEIVGKIKKGCTAIFLIAPQEAISPEKSLSLRFSAFYKSA